MSGNPIPTAEFDWANDDSIVAREQVSVAVYPNTRGGVVIRGERAWDEDSDAFIVIHAAHAQAVADAVLRAAAEAGEAIPEPKPSSRPQRHGAATVRPTVKPPAPAKPPAAAQPSLSLSLNGGGADR